MSFVLDTSVTMSWCFADEASDETDELLQRLGSEGAIAPSLWELEVANVLIVAERRGRLTEAQGRRFAALLRSLPIEIDRSAHPVTELLSLGRQHRLSGYDASYLMLAERTGLPLATRDDRLAAAARSAGVATVLEDR